MTPERRQRYDEAIRSLRAVVAPAQPGRGHLLEDAVLRDCDAAENYIAATSQAVRNSTEPADRMEAQRQKNTGARENLKTMRRALKEVRTYARAYRRQTGWALLAARFIGAHGDPDDLGVSEKFAQMLERFEKQLQVTTRARGAWISDVQVYNLLYPQAVSRRPPRLRPSTGLLFELCFLLRNYTAGVEEFEAKSEGQTMPEHGQPHYEVAAQFVEVATDDEVPKPAQRVLDLVERGVGLMSWKHLL